ncbi:uncharacterized protein [Haliotis cracherodii]|uniref:uncharacterized protein n=1 Tax=Haliotis cracherodii TaxID=6455 RepID=UPI0039ED985C
MAAEEGNYSPWSRRFCLQILFTTLFFILTQHGDEVLSLTVSSTNITKIRSQLKLTGVCRDNADVEQGHMDTWPSQPGACDNNICFMAQSANFIILETCREITNDENPDDDNCNKVADSSQSFPGCCPELQCSKSPPITTPSPTLCIDRSPSLSCWFWSNSTLGCSPNGTYYDAFLKDYCRKTCGLCT